MLSPSRPLGTAGKRRPGSLLIPDAVEARSAVAAARAWLCEALAAGPRPASELRQEAAAQGIGQNALYAARKAQRVTLAKGQRGHGRWHWALETAPDEREEGDGLPSP